MPKYNDGFHSDRRQGPDFIVRTANVLVVVIWPILFAGIILIGYARPQMETFFDKLLHVQLRTWWNRDLLLWFFVMMLCEFFLSILGLLLFSLRHRRKSDRIPVSLWLLLFASLVGCVLYFTI
jgi:hypothetical protein